MNKQPGYSKEVCGRAVRLVFTGDHNRSSAWAGKQVVATSVLQQWLAESQKIWECGSIS